MRAVIQRVSRAKVSAEGEEAVSIAAGYLVLVGVADTDGEAEAIKLGNKLVKLRLMADSDEKLNLNLEQAGGELLLISQFTLIADVGSGNRPSFIHAARGEQAERLFEVVVSTCRARLPAVKTGFFGRQMAVELTNDGPVTLVLDTDEF